ncbi:MAG TPA: phosphoribosylformylglycinamidine cyclo-ligase [Acidimicrobiia bacterium]|nr:phosphoribosylformylglycinamidine cyclo-ligase [Acidimicrobiia bacterium]
MGREAARREPLTYQRAGVDIGAGERAVELIKEHVRSTFRPEVVGDIGGFGGLFAFDPRGFHDPLLVSSTDGVGTKSVIARLMGKYDTIGIDLVAGSVDDVAVQGAEPLFFLDYISTGKVVEEIIAEIVSGVAHGCRMAGCALLGGEISEHDIMEPGEFDLVGFAVGAVERAEVLPSGVRAGDVIVGMASPGLRQNGYTLARKALLDRAGRRLDDPAWSGAHHTLGEELLRPSAIYAPAMRKLRERVPVHAFAHVTGGGIPANLARVLPAHCDARVTRGSWEEPRVFAEVQRAGDVPDTEMEHVFNLGLGMLAAVGDEDRLDTLDVIRANGHDAWLVGEIVEGRGRVTIESA